MIDMTQGNPLRLISRFALPLLAGNVLQQMYNMVDSIVVGNFVGKEALAAVGNSYVINFLLTSLFMGIGLGATILISQFFGAKQNSRIKETVDTMYIALLISGAAVTVIGIFIAEPLLRLMNTPEGITLDWSVEYLQILFLGTVFSFGYNINSGILQGLGDSKLPLLFLAIAAVLNVILDLVFVVAFGWGVFGVALATIISQAFSFLFGIWFMNRYVKTVHISLRRMRFNPSILIQSIRIGLPAGLQNMMFSLGTMVLQRLVNSYGPAFMAGYSSVGKIDSFAFMPISSFATAVTTYVGQNIGARKMDRVKTGVRNTLFMSGVLCIIISFLVIVFGRYLMMAFSNDEEVILTGVEFLKRLMPCYVLLSALFIFNAALRGAGSSILPLVSSIVSMLVFRVPLAYFLDSRFGKFEMFWCYGIGWAAGLLISGIYYISGRWKKKAYQTLEAAEGQG
ncbi:MATE family efflux transporter [Breznakiella homolactica]|uniref:MATE family efflux transporter n=1 Tax=Breznakiella homolactica TaxID=2798577 RepID=A0A7T7XLZ0_9SPIR|nr:MATE family efflux transporter [Breznakiella homolactica]QQO08821.1 MATE family efflux transporter [Breznakiella homolactica]